MGSASLFQGLRPPPQQQQQQPDGPRPPGGNPFAALQRDPRRR
jgi:hypothetical protein